MAVAGVAITQADIRDAAELLQGRVRRTPLLRAGELSRRFGGPVLLKAENLQLTGSFKLRGATCALLRLPEERRRRGVVAASAGNHAQAVAYAARGAGAGATLFMPTGAPLAKVAAVRRYGGKVHLVDGPYEEAGEAAREFAAAEGRPLLHPFDDPDVVAGQGTVGREIAQDAPELRLVLLPLGGGGLASGSGIALKSVLPDVRVVAVQAEGRASQTICDGIAVKRPGELTRPLLEQFVDEVVTVTDDEVAQAMVLLLERSKLVVEGAGAAAVAALMARRVQPPPGGATCAVLSGGNVDATLLAECIRMGETAAGRRMVLATVVPDRPGALAGLLRIVAEEGANIVDVEHIREGVDLHLRETAIHLTLQTRGPEHGRQLVQAVRGAGFRVRIETL
jgi:threonine dehydratase